MNNTIIAGDSFEYEIATSDYSNDDGYTAVLVLNGQLKYTLTSASSGTTHTFTETAANTKYWSAGAYSFVVYVTNGTVEKTVEAGTVDIKLRADLSGITDNRSHAKKMLDAIEALLEGRVVNDIDSYSINGRSVSKMSMEDLYKYRAVYRREVKKEKSTSVRTIKVQY